ncbi:MAG TPA: threonine--tRNA ligase [Thermoplasmatales archaeon]|nr:threonine--tRNA ligase [Thermoplasmatales archaeon]
MKLLLIHSDYIEYEVKDEAVKQPEEISEKKKRGRLEEALTVFIAVEKIDEKAKQEAVEQACNEIRKVAGDLKVSNIMIYPYAHLSSDLARPKIAMEILEGIEKELESDFKVVRSPFGWYKAFKISCKGHPLSELSREIVPKKEKTAVEKEKEIVSHWYILTPDGKLTDAESFDYTSYPELKVLYDYESKGTRRATTEPAHVKMMKRLELVDYEESSDSGNFRWYPKGRLVKGLLERYVTDICKELGGMQVETPIMYDIEHPALSEYVKKFPARQYIVRSDIREFFLRFAACFGQYMIAKDMVLSYKHMPIRLYELTHYSFRREQSGELSGLRRLRCFTMPDMHTICSNIDQAKEEFKRQFLASMRWMESLGLDYEVAIRFVRDFYEENKKFAEELVKAVGKPVLIEIWDERYFYFVMKFEFNVIDTTNKASALSTVQIDVENAKRFGIKYVDADGKEKHPYILHASISGSIDRCLYALLEREAIKIKKGEKPMLPLWLSPTQIRFIPIGQEFVGDCKRFVDELKGMDNHLMVRADIDDREESVARKIRDAEKEWIPIIIVIGEKERESGKFKPRFRRAELDDGKDDYTLEDIFKLVEKRVNMYPQDRLPLPEFLSKRAKFSG